MSGKSTEHNPTKYIYIYIYIYIDIKNNTGYFIYLVDHYRPETNQLKALNQKRLSVFDNEEVQNPTGNVDCFPCFTYGLRIAIRQTKPNTLR